VAFSTLWCKRLVRHPLALGLAGYGLTLPPGLSSGSLCVLAATGRVLPVFAWLPGLADLNEACDGNTPSLSDGGPALRDETCCDAFSIRHCARRVRGNGIFSARARSRLSRWGSYFFRPRSMLVGLQARINLTGRSMAYFAAAWRC